jgi:HAD superfamily hydrolase (TIGR01490 family)
MSIAFFDVDHTLIAGSSALLCAPVVRREGVGSRLMMASVVWAHLKHHLGLLDYEEVYARAVVPFAGMSLERLDRVLRECWVERVRPRVYREGVARMRRHKESGERVVLLSASSAWLLDLFREDLPVDEVLAFRQKTDGRCLINDFERPICYGPNKVLRARAYADALGIPLAECAFYSDSHSDLPMLAAVGRPFCVNPDPRLRLEAWWRGWPVLRFRETLGA